MGTRVFRGPGDGDVVLLSKIEINCRVLATEVDDAFILVAAWRNTNSRDSVAKRMKQSYSRTGVSITITSVTNIISFGVGVFASIPIVRYICIYAAIATFFSYLYLITFVGGCLAIDGYREERGRNPIIFLRKKGDESYAVSEDDGKDFFMEGFRSILGTTLNYPFAKLLIVVLFFINLATGLWGISSIVCGNDISDIFKTNGTFQKALMWHYQHFGSYSYPVHIIINHPLNYADPKIQTSIEELVEKFESHPHLADSSIRLSWLKYYKLFASSIAAKFSLQGYNISKKEDFVDGLYNVFLNFYQTRQFKQDVVFNENRTEIIASRFLVPTKDITAQSVELQIKDYTYGIADQSSLPIHVFGANFHLIEQAQLIKRTTFMTAIVASFLILFVFFMFVPNMSCSLSISAVVICMFCETIGYMSLWNVKLDIVSLLTLIVCAGFSINYPTHVCFSFVSVQNMPPEERVRKTLYEIGMPIFQGTVSSVLGVIVLAFQSYYSLKSVFKVIFLMTVQTAFHSMFFVLVLLSVLGSCDKNLSSTDDESCDVEVRKLETNYDCDFSEDDKESIVKK